MKINVNMIGALYVSAQAVVNCVAGRVPKDGADTKETMMRGAKEVYRIAQKEGLPSEAKIQISRCKNNVLVLKHGKFEVQFRATLFGTSVNVHRPGDPIKTYDHPLDFAPDEELDAIRAIYEGLKTKMIDIGGE